MKRVNDIIENRAVDLDDFEEKIEKLNKTKEDLSYYEKTPLPPSEGLRKSFIEEMELLKSNIYPLEKEVKEYYDKLPNLWEYHSSKENCIEKIGEAERLLKSIE